MKIQQRQIIKIKNYFSVKFKQALNYDE